MSVVPISLGAVNIEAADPIALGDFWASVTGGTLLSSGASAFLPAVSAEGFAMFFRPMEGPPPERNPTHMDLTVP